jgi:SAM-dependent methyltransferase
VTNNTKVDYKSYWQTKTDSGHRSSDPAFYQRKAIEQAALMSPQERAGPCLDLGCGAGELLEHLQHDLNVAVALDFSESMLDAARQRLSGSSIRLTNADLFDYLPTAAEPTWMTTGAINQYLDFQKTRRFLQLFTENRSARSLFLFDCVDPLRFAVLPFGSSYLPRVPTELPRWRAGLTSLSLWAHRVMTGIKIMLGLFDRTGVLLERGRMGFGYHPHHWRELIESFDLHCEIVSSLFYEYRFHIIIRKRPTEFLNKSGDREALEEAV